MKKKIIFWGILSLVLILAIGAVAIYNGYKNTLEDMHVNDNNPKDTKSETEKELDTKFEKPFVVLLYGIDQREGLNDQGRPDTLMLALIDAKEKKVNLISIPRDSYVDIPGRRSKDKINHSFSYGGVDLTIDTIEQWLDIPIYGYVAIDFKGFQELVDIVGGVDVYVDRSIKYDDPADGTSIHLTEGQQVLNGDDTLGFVRARLDNRGPRYYTSDYKRMERQQMVLKALGGKIVSLRSIPKVFDMMKVVGDNVATTLTPDELDYLVRKFYNFSMGNLQTTSIVGDALHINDMWVEDVPQAEIDRIHQQVTNFINRIPEPVQTEPGDEGAEDQGDSTDK